MTRPCSRLVAPAASGQVEAAALATPPHPLQITELPGEAAAGLAAMLAQRHGAGLTAINGGEQDATALRSSLVGR